MTKDFKKDYTRQLRLLCFIDDAESDGISTFKVLADALVDDVEFLFRVL